MITHIPSKHIISIDVVSLYTYILTNIIEPLMTRN